MHVRNQFALALWIASLGALGCAAGDDPRRDSGVHSIDGGPEMDSGSGDAGHRPDDGGRDGGTDAGPLIFAGTCEACEAHEDCGPGAFCISLTVGGFACVPACNPDIPSCPRSFNCV